MQKKKKPESIPQSKTRRLLFAIAEYAGDRLGELVDITLAHMSPRDRRILAHGDIYRVRELWAYEDRQYQKRYLERLKEQQCIVERIVGKRIYVALTEKGRARVLQERIRNAPACTDKECIIVIFDVPEQERSIRRQFRHFLKQCEFIQLQKSVWMHKCDVLDLLRAFIKDTKSERWVRVFRAHNVMQG